MTLRLGITTEFTTGTAGQVGDTACWTYNNAEKWDGTSRVVGLAHGHGTGSQLGGSQFDQNTGAGLTAIALARAGYIVVAPDMGGGATWGNATARDRLRSAVLAAQTRGGKSGKYGLGGWSMGCAAVLNLAKQHPTEVSAMWLWAPITDGDFVHSTAGHTPLANNASWTTEYETAFTNYAGSAGFRIWDEAATTFHNLGPKIRIAHATNDSVVPYSCSTSFVTSANDANVDLYSTSLTGDHTALFANVPDHAILEFYGSATWT